MVAQQYESLKSLIDSINEEEPNPAKHLLIKPVSGQRFLVYLQLLEEYEEDGHKYVRNFFLYLEKESYTRIKSFLRGWKISRGIQGPSSSWPIARVPNIDREELDSPAVGEHVC